MKRHLLALLVSSITTMAPAAELESLGAWTETINVANLLGGAGSTFSNPESVAGITTLSVTFPTVTWRVYARLNGGNWNPNVGLWIQRASNGSGIGSITGGTSYVQLTTTNTELFSGVLSRTNISLRFKSSGQSSSVVPGNYQAPILFTVVSP